METHSHKTNNREDQKCLSEALLHQYRTGKDYYVSENIEEMNIAIMQVWQQVSQPSISVSPPLSISTPSSPLITLVSP